MSEGYRVKLDVFTGPLDLLLYLIQRDEVDIYDIPIARITEEYLQQVRALEHLDPDAVSDFLVLAATLIELKSRALLPSLPPDTSGDADDPRAPLVKQLLEYKRFKDAAGSLGHAADDRSKRFVRVPAELPKELEGLELEEVEVWDLLAAFGQVMSAIGAGPGRHEVVYDDIPIELHAAEIMAILEHETPTVFHRLFDGQVERIQVVGRFLALLELIRSHRIRAEQEATFGTIYIFLLVEVPENETEDSGVRVQGPEEASGFRVQGSEEGPIPESSALSPEPSTLNSEPSLDPEPLIRTEITDDQTQ